MKIEANRKLLLTLVRGLIPPMHVCDDLTKQGAMEYTGNQHNPDWAWNSDFLKKCTDEQPLEIYTKISKLKED